MNIPMKPSESNYLADKIRRADDKNFNILSSVYEMLDLPYDKGTRKDDFILRKKIKNLLDEINRYYKINKSFEFYKAGAPGSCAEILGFYEERFLDSFVLGNHLSSVVLTLSQIMSWDARHNAGSHGKNIRKKNVFALEFEKKIEVWESKFHLYLTPSLFAYLDDINDIYLYGKLGELVSNHASVKSGADPRKRKLYADLIGDLKYFLQIKVKLKRKYFTESELIDALDRSLSEMGMKKLLLRAGLYDGENLKKIYRESVQSIELPGRFLGPGPDQKPTRAGTDYSTDVDHAAILGELKEFFSALNDMESVSLPADWDRAYPLHGPNEKNGGVLYDSTGDSPATLKKTADILRDSMLFISGWVIKMIVKNPELSPPLLPLVNAILASKSFITIHKISSHSASCAGYKSIGFGGLQKGRSIPKKTAKSLADAITITGNGLDQAFIATALLLMEPVNRKFCSTMRMTNILRESYAASYKRIKEGIAGIRTKLA